MDGDERSGPPKSEFGTIWPVGTDESNHLFFFGPDAESSILREFGWADHHHSRCLGDLDQIETDFSGNHNLQACLPESTKQFQSEEVPDESSTKPSVSSTTSEDPSEKSTGSVVKSPEIPGKSVRKKGQKRIKQPRFAFMTKSKVDHLEDGYRWRKYGQKAVKNSPFPRSYYRCTNSKCTVKKRVERSSKDPETVITTYEGQHCHQAAGLRVITAAPYTGHYPRVVPARESVVGSTHSRDDHMSSSSSANHHQHQSHSNSQGLLGDIVPPTMRN